MLRVGKSGSQTASARIGLVIAGSILGVLLGTASSKAGEAFDQMLVKQAQAVEQSAPEAEPVAKPRGKKIRVARVPTAKPGLPPPAGLKTRLANGRKGTNAQIAAGRRPGRAQIASELPIYQGRVAVRTGRARTAGGFSGRLAACIPGALRSVLSEVARRYGAVRINSSYRSPGHNRAVGGARHSFHMVCRAVDFRVAGNGSAVLSFIKASPLVGGYKRYRSGYFHIDTGPRRTWRG